MEVFRHYLSDSIHHLLVLIVIVVVHIEGAHGSAGEEDHPLHLPVVEEVVEVPDGAVLPEWIRGQVWVVRVEFAVQEFNLLVQCHPELVVYLPVLTRR